MEEMLFIAMALKIRKGKAQILLQMGRFVGG